MLQAREYNPPINVGFIDEAGCRYIWPLSWGPTYRYSYGICIAASGTAIIMAWIFKQHLISLNEKLEREEQEKGIKEKGFRYLL